MNASDKSDCSNTSQLRKLFHISARLSYKLQRPLGERAGRGLVSIARSLAGCMQDLLITWYAYILLMGGNMTVVLPAASSPSALVDKSGFYRCCGCQQVV